MRPTDDLALIARLWRDLGGAPELAASVALATLAAAELHGARCGSDPPRVRVARAHAALAFRRELYATPLGWEMLPLWDPIAGDYAARRMDPPGRGRRGSLVRSGPHRVGTAS